jgi:hypothetical protein
MQALLGQNDPEVIRAGLDRIRAYRQRYDEEVRRWQAADIPAKVGRAIRAMSEGPPVSSGSKSTDASFLSLRSECCPMRRQMA